LFDLKVSSPVGLFLRFIGDSFENGVIFQAAAFIEYLPDYREIARTDIVQLPSLLLKVGLRFLDFPHHAVEVRELAGRPVLEREYQSLDGFIANWADILGLLQFLEFLAGFEAGHTQLFLYFVRYFHRRECSDRLRRALFGAELTVRVRLGFPSGLLLTVPVGASVAGVPRMLGRFLPALGIITVLRGSRRLALLPLRLRERPVLIRQRRPRGLLARKNFGGLVLAGSVRLTVGTVVMRLSGD